MNRLCCWRLGTKASEEAAGPARVYVAVFLVLNLADWLLTRWLVGETDGAVGEANPLADAVLTEHGWWGVGAYKLAAVAFVLVVGRFVARRRPASALRLWRVSCALLLLLVGYQIGLVAFQPWDEDDRETLAAMHREAAELDEALQDSNAFRGCVHRRSEELLAGRGSLSGAVAMLEEDLGSYPQAVRDVVYPGYDKRAALALRLMAEVSARSEREDRGHLRRLADEFQAVYRQPIPYGLAVVLDQPSSVQRSPEIRPNNQTS